MASRLNLRVDPNEYETWQRAAAASGSGLSEWARRSLSDRAAGRDAGAISDRIASKVALILLPEIERIVQEANGASPQPPTTHDSSEPPQPQVYGPFDPACYEADLHRLGVRCSGCGGSFKARA